MFNGGNKVKIVSLPGIGFHNDHTKYDDFAKYIGKTLCCDSEMYYWRHEWPLPTVTLPYVSLREWTYEVILDFQHVILHTFDTPIPPANYYIGHSAGSVLALAQKDVSCVIFGSPACLVETIKKSDNLKNSDNGKLIDSIRSKKHILNIINRYDQMAYYLDFPNVENWVFEGPWYSPSTYEPIGCHRGYWENSDVRKKITETIYKWEYNPV